MKALELDLCECIAEPIKRHRGSYEAPNGQATQIVRSIFDDELAARRRHIKEFSERMNEQELKGVWIGVLTGARRLNFAGGELSKELREQM